MCRIANPQKLSPSKFSRYIRYSAAQPLYTIRGGGSCYPLTLFSHLCRHKVPYHVLLNLYCPVSAECPGNHGDEETTSVLRNLVSEHLSHDQVSQFIASLYNQGKYLWLKLKKYRMYNYVWSVRTFYLQPEFSLYNSS